MTIKKRNYLTVVIFSIILLLLLSLGGWQLYKYKINSLIAEKFNSLIGSRIVEIDCGNTNLNDLIFHKVRITGTILNQYEQHLFYGSLEKGKGSGYFILNPLACSSGGSLLINRGWVPEKYKNYLDRNENIIMPTTIEGILMPASYRNFFSPTHKKEYDILFWTDIDFIKAKIGFDLPNYYILQTNNYDNHFTYYPLYKTQFKKLPHLQYAIFWFSMAIIWCFIAVLTKFKRNKNEQLSKTL